jgi:hypothetical protein
MVKEYLNYSELVFISQTYSIGCGSLANLTQEFWRVEFVATILGTGSPCCGC